MFVCCHGIIFCTPVFNFKSFSGHYFTLMPVSCKLYYFGRSDNLLLHLYGPLLSSLDFINKQ